MSWSISIAGTPSNLSAALDKESLRLTGNSKAEFDEALPAMKTLLKMNYSSGIDASERILKLCASGHAYSDKDRRYGNVSIDLKDLGVVFVN